MFPLKLAWLRILSEHPNFIVVLDSFFFCVCYCKLYTKRQVFFVMLTPGNVQLLFGLHNLESRK